MDAHRFDRLVHSLSATGTRRTLLSRLAALLLAGSGSALLGTAIDTAARRRKRRHKRKHKKRCHPKSTAQTCEGKCALVSNNCGSQVDCGPCDGDDVCCGGACCDGCCGSDGACGSCVFVTSTTFTGNLDGLAGADASCQELAEAAGLPGTYKAWLSIGNGTEESPANGRFIPSTRPYLLVNGAQIAANWADLTGGTLDTKLNVTESGTTLPDTEFAWTYTLSDGAAGGLSPNQHCLSWTSASHEHRGDTGKVSLTDAGWTDGSLLPCQVTAHRHLYCFQQS